MAVVADRDRHRRREVRGRGGRACVPVVPGARGTSLRPCRVRRRHAVAAGCGPGFPGLRHALARCEGQCCGRAGRPRGLQRRTGRRTVHRRGLRWVAAAWRGVRHHPGARWRVGGDGRDGVGGARRDGRSGDGPCLRRAAGPGPLGVRLALLGGRVAQQVACAAGRIRLVRRIPVCGVPSAVVHASGVLGRRAPRFARIRHGAARDRCQRRPAARCGDGVGGRFAGAGGGCLAASGRLAARTAGVRRDGARGGRRGVHGRVGGSSARFPRRADVLVGASPCRGAEAEPRRGPHVGGCLHRPGRGTGTRSGPQGRGAGGADAGRAAVQPEPGSARRRRGRCGRPARVPPRGGTVARRAGGGAAGGGTDDGLDPREGFARPAFRLSRFRRRRDAGESGRGASRAARGPGVGVRREVRGPDAGDSLAAVERR